MRRPLLVYGGLALGLATVDLALPAHGRGVPLVGQGVVLTFGMCEGIRRNRPRSRAPWLLLLGTVLLAVAAVAIHAAVGGNELDMPMVSDVMILAGLVCWCAASALFVRARSRVLDRYQLLDLGIILISATVALKRLALDPAMEAHPPQGMSPSLSMSMILLMVVALALFVRFVTLRGPRPLAMWLVLSSLGTSLFGSVLSNAISPETGLHLSLYLSGTATMLASLHPTMTALTAPSKGTAPNFGPVRAAMLGVAVLLPPVTAAVVHARTDDLPIVWFLAPTFAVTTLVLLRLRLQFAHEREAQDELAAASHQKLGAAYEAGWFEDQITPFRGLEKDNNLRPGSTVEKLATLKPVFGVKGGTPAAPSGGSGEPTTVTPPPTTTSSDLQQAIAAAQRDEAKAESALRNGDFAAYGRYQAALKNDRRRIADAAGQ